MGSKISIISNNIQVETLGAMRFYILQYHSGFAHPTRTDNTRQAAFPIYFIVFIAIKLCWSRLQQFLHIGIKRIVNHSIIV